MRNVRSPLSNYDGTYGEFRYFLEQIKKFTGAYEIGRSEEGRPIHMIEIGEAPNCILSFAGVHGNEKLAIKGVSRTLKMLIAGEMDNILDKVSYIAVPIMNPDGEEKDRRKNAKGIDINRDFGKYGLFSLRGSEFKSPEARAAKNLIDKCVKNYENVLVLDHHNNNWRPVPEFYTMESGEPEEVVTEVGFHMRKSARELMSEIGFYEYESVFNWGPSGNRGLLVNYSSRSCPSILVEVSWWDETHTTADLSALKTFSEILYRDKSLSSPKKVPSRRLIFEEKSPEDRTSVPIPA